MAFDDEYISRKEAILAVTNDGCTANVVNVLYHLPSADVAPRAEVIAEYRKKVYAKMEKYTIFGREYMQRIMREVEKEYTEGKDDT